jgi:hypothetical protein
LKILYFLAFTGGVQVFFYDAQDVICEVEDYH